mmetsp:Transcript_6559/g.19891  ORF Transcript_6559/g.19891 Transcript_6559/m.19891 type:complete len:213 (-) Transcript_6559:1000-1638(-)
MNQTRESVAHARHVILMYRHNVSVSGLDDRSVDPSKLIGFRRPLCPDFIRHWLDRTVWGLELLQGRGEKFPRNAQLIVVDEQRLVSVDGVKDESLICVCNVLALLFKRSLVQQVETGEREILGQARNLVYDAHAHCLVGLNPYNNFIADLLAGEKLHASALFETDADLGLSVVKVLACGQKERHSLPPLIVDVHDAGCKCRSDRALGHTVLL